MTLIQTIKLLNSCVICGDLRGFVESMKNEDNGAALIQEALSILKTNYQDVLVKDLRTYNGHAELRQIDKGFLQQALGELK